MKVCNWDKWQSFRKDRGAPPWIKVHRNLLTNEQWVELSDAEKGQLVSIWMLAADKDGVIPDSAKMIQKMAMLDSKPNLSKFIDLGFMTTTCQPDDNQENKDGCQDDAPEESRVEESRVDQIRVEEIMSNKFDDDAKSIFDYWCLVMKTDRSAFSPKREKAVINRLKEGYLKSDIETAIVNCSNTPHNMGQNPNRKKYNDIELICRSPEKLESFRDNPGTLNNQFNEKTEQNISAFKQLLENNQGDKNELN